jgi:hypothetical protein
MLTNQNSYASIVSIVSRETFKSFQVSVSDCLSAFGNKGKAVKVSDTTEAAFLFGE